MRIRKPLSILLICAMIITMLPVMSFAGDEDGQTAAANTGKAIRLNTDGIAGCNNRKYLSLIHISEPTRP